MVTDINLENTDSWELKALFLSDAENICWINKQEREADSIFKETHVIH